MAHRYYPGAHRCYPDVPKFVGVIGRPLVLFLFRFSWFCPDVHTYYVGVYRGLLA